MKTTLEIPEELFREAKATAARKGQSLKQLVAEAIREKLAQDQAQKPWLKHFGALAHLRPESRRIEKIIEQEFESIDRNGWR